MWIWTPERLSKAHQLYIVEGKSASETAEMVGAISRSAIIGIAHRNGWRKGRPTPPAPKAPRLVKAPTVKPAPKPKAPKPIKAPVVVGVDFVASRDADKKRAEHAARGRATINAAIDPVNDNAIPLLERRFGQCAWPVGTPEHASDQMVCGGLVYQGVEACPYCLTHAKRAYVRDITQPMRAEDLARSLRRWA